jgi:hypothetical protein
VTTKKLDSVLLGNAIAYVKKGSFKVTFDEDFTSLLHRTREN